jgi:hypothetical protein
LADFVSVPRQHQKNDAKSFFINKNKIKNLKNKENVPTPPPPPPPPWWRELIAGIASHYLDPNCGFEKLPAFRTCFGIG